MVSEMWHDFWVLTICTSAILGASGHLQLVSSLDGPQAEVLKQELSQ